LKIEITEEGGCELYSIYKDGEKIQEYLTSSNIIEIDFETKTVTLDGIKI